MDTRFDLNDKAYGQEIGSRQNRALSADTPRCSEVPEVSLDGKAIRLQIFEVDYCIDTVIIIAHVPEGSPP
jgi:hypothetical protein